MNLENALTEKGELLHGKAYYHRGNPAHVDGLVEAGFSCVNVANNHVLDFGELALFDTLDQLEIGMAAIDAGAHAVFGGRQHVVSAIEFYNRCPIVQCSGNLLFDKWERAFARPM